MAQAEVIKKRGRPPKSETKNDKEKFAFLKDDRFKILLGIFLLFFTLYIAIAFVSFFFTWKEDMNLFEKGFFGLMTTPVIAANAMGKMGLYLSKLFIFKLFGITAIGLLFLFPLWAFKLFNIKLPNFNKTVFRTLYIMIWFSLTLAFIAGKTKFFIGGTYPYEITKWLSGIIGKFGMGVVLLISGLGFVFFTFDNAFEWTRKFFENIATSGNLKTAWQQTNSNIKFFGTRKKSDDTPTEQNDDYEPDFIGNNTPAQQAEQNEQFVENKDFILTPDGRRIPKSQITSNENKEDIGFEIETPQTEETVEPTDDDKQETPFETPEQINANIENGFEVSTNEDLLGGLEQLEDYDPTKSLSNFRLPPLTLLKNHKLPNSEVTEKELLENRNKIVQTLKNYKIEITKIKATVGPTVTLYEIVPAPGVRISKIRNLQDDIALSLAAMGIRIIAPMPGRGTIGIEVPNKNPSIVSMKSVLSSKKFQKTDYELPIALGKTISNETLVFDLAKMPHLLIAGATGQGKSVGINAILASLLYKKHPAFVKFVLIDPKKVELVTYEKIEKHYLAKLPGEEDAIVTDNKKVIYTLNSLNVEMDERYQLLKAARVRNIKEYNEKFINRKLNPNNGHRFLPYIVLVIDEFADLIMTAGKEIETPIARLAQLARAIGIHLIVATQRPSTNIITGLIKANFPARIAFRVASMIDSRTILDQPGANQLIGRGDLLFARGSDTTRIQCAFIDTEEINNIVDYIGNQQGYPEVFELPEPKLENEEESLPGDVDLKKRDALFDDAAKIVVINQSGSTSLIQRKFSIGYNRAGRIMDQLEAAGIVGPAQGSKPREVYITDLNQLNAILTSLNEDTNNFNGF